MGDKLTYIYSKNGVLERVSPRLLVQSGPHEAISGTGGRSVSLQPMTSS